MARGNYDKEKDQEVRDLGIHQIGSSEIRVRIMRYNGGEQKLDMRKLVTYNEKTNERPLGRLTREEAMELGSILAELSGEESFWIVE